MDFIKILQVFIRMFMDYITLKNQLTTPPNTFQNPPKNTPKYPPNPTQNTMFSFFLSGDGITN